MVAQAQLSLDLHGARAARPPVAERLALPDADLVLFRNFFSSEESNAYFEDLLTHTHWKQEQIELYGKVHDVPRLTAWHGDFGKSYGYSGIQVHAAPWTDILMDIKTRVESAAAMSFNSVLLNLYRDGRDGVSWHSENEAKLGADPVIASVSFGEARAFQLRRKMEKGPTIPIILRHGSLLLMRGPTQHYWVHRVPKIARKLGPRINLTFRVIESTH